MAFMIPVAQAVGSFVMANVGTIASLGLAGLSAVSGMQAAGAQQQAAYDTAAQLDQRAKQERALSHLEIARKARDDRAQLSANKTAAATSGFSTDDPSMAALLTDTVGEQTLQQMLIKAQGESSARSMEADAKQMRRAGTAQAKATQAQTIAQFGGDMISWGQRYGNAAGPARGLRNATATGQKSAKKVRTG